MILFWGKQWTQVYNGAVADLLGSSEAFGTPVSPDWHRHWDMAQSPFEALAQGRSCSYEDRFRWLNRSGTPKSSWFTLSFSPVLTSTGEVTGAVMILIDTTVQAMAELAAENAAQRLRALLTVTPDCIFRLSGHSPELIDLDGREFTKSIAGPSTEWLKQIVPAVEETRVANTLQQGMATRRPFEFEHRVIKQDGSLGWACSRAVPIFDITRRVKEWYGAMTDISSRKGVEERLRHSERQLRRFGQASQDLLWIRDGASLELEYLSPAAAEICGEFMAVAAAREQWVALIHPADRTSFIDNLNRVRSGEVLHHGYRIRRGDNTTRWIQSYDFPILDESGRLCQIAGIARDVTDNEEFAGRQALLITELNHRTRSLMAIAKSLVSRTLDSCDSVDEFDEVVEHRLSALAGVGDPLSRAAWTFEDLLQAILQTLHIGNDPRVFLLSGSDAGCLEVDQVPTLALAMHELLSNSIQHGALSEPTGRIEIGWHVRSGFEPCLRVDWRETGTRSLDRGRQDREMIENSLRYRVGTETSFEPTESGLAWTLDIPLTR
jgi:two-component system CheB/CheR fusion protein